MMETSGLTLLRRMGVRCVAPLEMFPRMDGKLSFFTKAEVREAPYEKQQQQPISLLRVPLSSSLHCQQRCFKPAPMLWRNTTQVASRTNFPVYFEAAPGWEEHYSKTGGVVGGEVSTSWTKFNESILEFETADEQEQYQRRLDEAFRERKWMEGTSALFFASCHVLHSLLLRSSSSSSSPSSPLLVTDSPTALLHYFAFMFSCHSPDSPLSANAAPTSIEEVELRFRIFQSRALLESCLMDAITITAEPEEGRALFGELAAVPQTLSDVVTQAVDMSTSGGVFRAPCVFSKSSKSVEREETTEDQQAKNRSPRAHHHGSFSKFFVAPVLSSVCSTSSPLEANCRIVCNIDTQSLDLIALRPIRTGEELLRLEL